MIKKFIQSCTKPLTVDDCVAGFLKNIENLRDVVYRQNAIAQSAEDIAAEYTSVAEVSRKEASRASKLADKFEAFLKTDDE